MTYAQMVEAEVEKARREPRPVVQQQPEIHNETAIRAMTRTLLPQLRADQKVLQRAAAQNEILRRQNAAANSRAFSQTAHAAVDEDF